MKARLSTRKLLANMRRKLCDSDKAPMSPEFERGTKADHSNDVCDGVLYDLIIWDSSSGDDGVLGEQSLSTTDGRSKPPGSEGLDLRLPQTRRMKHDPLHPRETPPESKSARTLCYQKVVTTHRSSRKVARQCYRNGRDVEGTKTSQFRHC